MTFFPIFVFLILLVCGQKDLRLMLVFPAENFLVYRALLLWVEHTWRLCALCFNATYRLQL